MRSRMRVWALMAARHPQHFDVALALITFAVSAFAIVHTEGVSETVLPAVGVACAALAGRRHHPPAVLVISVVGAEAALTHPHTPEVVLLAPLIALYTVAELGGWRRTLALGVLAVATVTGFHVMVRPAGPLTGGALTLAAFGGLAIAAGSASRNRRAYTAAVEERARQAERDRELSAARRVTEDRLRIARELHDVLGHQLAMINVQVRVAERRLDDRPEEARRSLGHVRQASQAALAELKATVGVLREGDAPTAPGPGLSALDGLIASFRGSGLRVIQEIEGEARPVPPATDLTAYRVIQESLTNVSKHAAATTATVRLSYEPAALRILVEDDGTRRPHARVGHGLAGMRERVAADGGQVTAGARAGGGYQVSAWLPL